METIETPGKKSFNSVSGIICADLKYQQRTVQVVVQKCLNEITPINNYINVTHFSDKSIKWESNIEIDNFNIPKTT